MSILQLSDKECWFLEDKDIDYVLQLLEQHKGQAYIVGGAVRNIFFDCASPLDDIDIATNLRPDIVQMIAEDNDIKIVTSGIAHGTVTWVIKGRAFEITTFRYDTQTDGRHAIVTFSDTIEEDAIRRDFTVNALYCDKGGKVYCPVTEMEDLQKKNINFIGNISQRIHEDYLRILRYFRFVSLYGLPNNFESVCKEIRKTILIRFKRPSSERNFIEFKKMVIGPYFKDMIPMLQKYKILEYFFDCPLSVSQEKIQHICDIIKKYNIAFQGYIWVTFLFEQTDIQNNAAAFRLSRLEKRHIYKIFDLYTLFQNREDLYSILIEKYDCEKSVFHAALLKYIIFHPQERAEILFTINIPECNISAQDLIKKGVAFRDLKAKIKALRYDNLRLKFPNL